MSGLTTSFQSQGPILVPIKKTISKEGSERVNGVYEVTTTPQHSIYKTLPSKSTRHTQQGGIIKVPGFKIFHNRWTSDFGVKSNTT